jgi:hypothetical protein
VITRVGSRAVVVSIGVLLVVMLVAGLVISAF